MTRRPDRNSRNRRLASVIGVVLTAVSGPSAAQEVFGREVVVPAVRGEPEPGTVFVANWSATEQGFAGLLRRPRSEDAAVIAEIRAMGDAALPPYLMEMGRRISATDPVEGAYWYRIGLLRTQWAGFNCADTSARQAATILILMLNTADPEFVQTQDQPAVRLPPYERMGAGDVVFESTASAWWICSHGLGAMTAALGAGPDGPGEIPLDVWRSSDAERDRMEARLRDYLPQWAAADRAALEATGS